MPAKVFLSYSRQDEMYAKELALQLRALEPAVVLWRDVEKMPPGTPDFAKELEQAAREADVLVSLISQDQANSDWCDKEWAWAGDARALRIAVLLHPYGIDLDARFAGGQFIVGEDIRAVAEGRAGAEHRDTRRGHWVHVVRELKRGILAHPRAAGAVGPVLPPHVAAVPRLDRKKHDRPPQKLLSLRYAAGVLARTDARGRTIVVDGERPGTPDPERLLDWVLPRLVLDDGRIARDVVLASVFDAPEKPTPGPRRYPVRLRLDVPAELQDLPWHGLAEGEHPLLVDRWTVELATDGPARIPNPARVLVVADGEQAHVDALSHNLSQLWGNVSNRNFVVCRDADTLPEALHDLRPHVVHVVADGARGGFWMPRGEGGRATVPWSSFDEVDDVALVMAVTPGATPPGRRRAWVMQPPSGARTEHLDDARTLFDDIFRYATAPVVSVARVNVARLAAARQEDEATKVPSRPAHRIPGWRVGAPAQGMDVGRPLRAAMKDAPTLLLDRSAAKSDALHTVQWLLAQVERPIACAVGVGSAEDKVAWLPNQARDYVSRNVGEKALLVDLSPVEWTPAQGIGGALRAILGADLRAEVLAQVDRARGSRRDVKVLFWLPWQVAGKALGRGISPTWIAAWHHAVADLMPACRDLPQLRIFSLLPVEAEAAHHDAIRALGAATASGVHGLGLHAVGDVAYDDLLRFMTHPSHTTCREDDAEAAARGLFHALKGRFVPTCEAIQAANRDGYDRWADLGRSLPRAAPDPEQEY